MLTADNQTAPQKASPSRAGSERRGVAAETVQAFRQELGRRVPVPICQRGAATGSNDRAFREIIEQHGEEFLSGNDGYKLMTAATDGEISACIGRLESQADKMRERALQLRKLRAVRAPFVQETAARVPGETALRLALPQQKGLWIPQSDHEAFFDALMRRCYKQLVDELRWKVKRAKCDGEPEAGYVVGSLAAAACEAAFQEIQTARK